MDWLSPESKPFHQQGNVRQTLEKFLETSLGALFDNGGQVTFIEMTAYDSAPFLSESGLSYPIPDEPKNLDDLFEAFSNGTATNPSVTFCPTHTDSLG